MLRINTWYVRYKYLRDEEPESTSSWISFEREYCEEDVRDFRFAKFLTDRQKYWLDWTETKNPPLKVCKRLMSDVSFFYICTYMMRMNSFSMRMNTCETDNSKVYHHGSHFKDKIMSKTFVVLDFKIPHQLSEILIRLNEEKKFHL